jgi:hypothetical protein
MCRWKHGDSIAKATFTSIIQVGCLRCQSVAV